MKKFNEISKLIKNARRNAKLSQEDIAYLLGYKGLGQYISNIERGKCSLPKKDITRLAIILKINPDEIIQAMIEDYAFELYSYLNNENYSRTVIETNESTLLM